MKKLSNKGFTLVEVLSIVAIIAIIGLIAVPSVLSIINTGKDSSYKIMIENVKTASIDIFKEIDYMKQDIYRYDTEGNKSDEPINIEQDSIDTNLQTLVRNGFLSVSSDHKNSKTILNPKTNENIGDCKIKITKYVSNAKVCYKIEGYNEVEDNDICPTTEDFGGNEQCSKNDINESEKYEITYDCTGGEGVVCGRTDQKRKSEDLKLSDEVPTKIGHKFLGWSDSSVSNTVKYGKEDIYQIDQDATLYAVWEVNTVTIKYNVNGSVISSTKKKYEVNDDGFILNGNDFYTTVVKYNDKLGEGGLLDYNDSSLDLRYKGLSCGAVDERNNVVLDKEWKCISEECKVDAYNQIEIYAASDFCDLSNDSCIIELYFNWYHTALDLNGYLDGRAIYSISDYGTADLYVNGVKIADDVDDYCNYINWKYGDEYKIEDIKAKPGMEYKGVKWGSLEGTIGVDNSSVYLIFDTIG